MNNIILQNSNQPYLYLNQQDTMLLYCFADHTIDMFFGNYYSIKPWKIQCKNLTTSEVIQVDTPKSHPEHGNVVIECNPHIQTINNVSTLYYVAGFNKGPNTAIIYYLCSVPVSDLSLKDINSFSNLNVIKRTFTGTVFNNYIIYNNKHSNGQIFKENIDNSELVETVDLSSLGLTSLLKICKIYNDNKFIITSQIQNSQFVSLLLDENFNLIKEILNNYNESVYKCSILNDKLVYTVRLQDNSVENRHLVEEMYV